MAQQGVRVKVGACKGFPCNSVKLVLLANCNRYKVDSKTIFLNREALDLSIQNTA
jgi:hypothetical protein